MATQTFNFGDDAAYSSGFTLPEGDYVWTDLTIKMHEGFGEKKYAQATLGVIVTLLPLADPKPENERKQFYGFGRNAHKSWMPDPDTGKKIIAVPGGEGTGLNAQTNWAIVRKSLMDCGLPPGVLTDDISVLEGIRVHMTLVNEPEERKTFAAATGESGEQRKDNKIPIVTEIKDDGKPWEGTGGVPEVKKGPKKTTAAVKPASKPTSKPAPAPDPQDDDNDAILAAAINGVSEVLEKNPGGCPKIALKTGAFSSIKKADGDEMAQKVSQLLSTDDGMTAVLDQVGYKLAGMKVVPA